MQGAAELGYDTAEEALADFATQSTPNEEVDQKEGEYVLKRKPAAPSSEDSSEEDDSKKKRKKRKKEKKDPTAPNKKAKKAAAQAKN